MVAVYEGEYFSRGEKGTVFYLQSLLDSIIGDLRFLKAAITNRLFYQAYNAMVLGDESNMKYDDRPFATGNWGCGAFRGDKELKSNFVFVLEIYFLRVLSARYMTPFEYDA